MRQKITTETLYVGCCGACCRTCRPLAEGFCKGCKLGYGKGQRDISKTKCKIKVCCFKEKGFATCADCADFAVCKIINVFYGKKGYKYKKYKEALEFISQNGYEKFLKIAGKWSGPYGKY